MKNSNHCPCGGFCECCGSYLWDETQAIYACVAAGCGQPHADTPIEEDS